MNCLCCGARRVRVFRDRVDVGRHLFHVVCRLGDGFALIFGAGGDFRGAVHDFFGALLDLGKIRIGRLGDRRDHLAQLLGRTAAPSTRFAPVAAVELGQQDLDLASLLLALGGDLDPALRILADATSRLVEFPYSRSRERTAITGSGHLFNQAQTAPLTQGDQAADHENDGKRNQQEYGDTPRELIKHNDPGRTQSDDAGTGGVAYDELELGLQQFAP